MTLEVNPSTILNWEKGRTEPPVEAMPALLQFLGYDPLSEPTTLPERMLRTRQGRGWSIKEAALRLGYMGCLGDRENSALATAQGPSCALFGRARQRRKNGVKRTPSFRGPRQYARHPRFRRRC